MSDFSQNFLDQLRAKQEANVSKSDPKISTPLEDSTLLMDSVPSSAEEGNVQEVRDDKGILLQRFSLAEDKIKGKRELYSAETGKLVQTISYENGILQGPLYGFDAEGKIIQEIPYENGKKEGLAVFYVQGIKIADINFKNDMMEGPAIYYNPAGYVSIITSYKNDKLEGEYNVFGDKKNLIKKCFYKEGNLDGLSQIFYPNGKILEEVVYKSNIPQSALTQYFESGKVRLVRTYDALGHLTQEEIFKENGELQERTKVPAEKV